MATVAYIILALILAFIVRAILKGAFKLMSFLIIFGVILYFLAKYVDIF
jgi:hypothetical protein